MTVTMMIPGTRKSSNRNTLRDSPLAAVAMESKVIKAFIAEAHAAAAAKGLKLRVPEDVNPDTLLSAFATDNMYRAIMAKLYRNFDDLQPTTLLRTLGDLYTCQRDGAEARQQQQQQAA